MPAYLRTGASGRSSYAGQRLVVCALDRSVPFPAQAYFALALSFEESAPRGAGIEQESHDGGVVADGPGAVKEENAEG